MRITKVTAKNYKTLEDIKIEFIGNCCAISGINNSGKSALIKLLLNLFYSGNRPWGPEPETFDYAEDKTQWIKNDDPIIISYCLKVTRGDDPSLMAFIEKIASVELEQEAIICIRYEVAKYDSVTIGAQVQDTHIDEQSAREITSKLKSSNLLFLHNSTIATEDHYYVSRGRARSFYHFMLSDEEQKALTTARKTVSLKIQKLAKQHKSGLSDLLARLSEKYEVEFTSIESYSSKHVPFVINLKDKNVQIPLTEWGSGTQNRTQILMSILQANRIKEQGDPKDKITPIVVVEEPESFLHPSAQAEFGKLLRSLSAELGIQLILTTHNPHMLNHEAPESNILLSRKVERNKPVETYQIDTTGENWMAPFAEHLGMLPSEFQPWNSAFTSQKEKVLLVEGPLDVEYFEHIRKHNLTTPNLLADIEIVPYGGKDVLKNTLLGSLGDVVDFVELLFAQSGDRLGNSRSGNS